MDQKAQISVEFVLLIGFIFVIVLIIASYVGEQNELDTVSVVARDGAMQAVSQITLVNRNLPATMVNTVTMTGDQNKTIQIKLSSSLSASNKNIILNKTLDSIAAQGYTREINNPTILTDDIIVTGRHKYTVLIV